MAINQENLDPKKSNKDDVTRKGEGISQDREHMAEIGKKDDQAQQQGQQQKQPQQPAIPGQAKDVSADKDTLKK
jgi:general stress protein YciG